MKLKDHGGSLPVMDIWHWESFTVNFTVPTSVPVQSGELLCCPLPRSLTVLAVWYYFWTLLLNRKPPFHLRWLHICAKLSLLQSSKVERETITKFWATSSLFVFANSIANTRWRDMRFAICRLSSTTVLRGKCTSLFQKEKVFSSGWRGFTLTTVSLQLLWTYWNQSWLRFQSTAQLLRKVRGFYKSH